MSSSQDIVSDILKTVEALTGNGKRELDDKLMKTLKKKCKLSEDYVNYTYHAVMTQLRKDHSEVRYSTLLVVNEMFIRSSVFRKLLEEDLEEFLELVLETDMENPLPLPKVAAKELKLKGLQYIQEWSTKFGSKYNRLNLAFSYLKNCKLVDFNDLEVRNSAQRERQSQELGRQERAISEKVHKAKLEMQGTIDEILSILTQTENCFRLLVPHPSDFFSTSDFEVTNASVENCKTSYSNLEADASNNNIDKNKIMQEEINATQSHDKLRQHGVHDMKSHINVQLGSSSEVVVEVTEDTLPIVENLNDLHRQISSKYLPLVSKWLKVLMKGNNCTDLLKKAIDLKQLIEASLQKHQELKIKQDFTKLACHSNNKADDDDDDDDFEEVKEKEGYEPEVAKYFEKTDEIFMQPCCSSKRNPIQKEANTWKLRHHEHEALDPTSGESTGNILVKKYGVEQSTAKICSDRNLSKKNYDVDLLAKAPVLPYDIDLYHWEEEKLVTPEVIKFDSLHSFWQSKNDDQKNEALEKETIACLRRRRIDFSGKFEPVKWSCRAPLPSGKLCPRRDRYKCPFHGVIIKRDSQGNPVDVKIEISSEARMQVSTQDIPEWQDPALLADIEAATGINLKVPQKRKVKGKCVKKKSTTISGLTNIKVAKNDVRDRISKKILKRYRHYARKLDEIERKKFKYCSLCQMLVEFMYNLLIFKYYRLSHTIWYQKMLHAMPTLIENRYSLWYKIELGPSYKLLHKCD